MKKYQNLQIEIATYDHIDMFSGENSWQTPGMGFGGGIGEGETPDQPLN